MCAVRERLASYEQSYYFSTRMYGREITRQRVLLEGVIEKMVRYVSSFRYNHEFFTKLCLSLQKMVNRMFSWYVENIEDNCLFIDHCKSMFILRKK